LSHSSIRAQNVITPRILLSNYILILSCKMLELNIDLIRSFSIQMDAQTTAIQNSRVKTQRQVKQLRIQRFSLSLQELGKVSRRAQNIIATYSTPQQLYLDLKI